MGTLSCPGLWIMGCGRLEPSRKVMIGCLAGEWGVDRHSSGTCELSVFRSPSCPQSSALCESDHFTSYKKQSFADAFDLALQGWGYTSKDAETEDN